MTNFDNHFFFRHEQALLELPQRIGLEYFGIDCAESHDGELVVFKADNALIVHDMDPHEVFPYKREQMHNLLAAFTEMLCARANVPHSLAGSLHRLPGTLPRM